MLLQSVFNLRRKLGHILRVLNDRKPFTMLVRRYALKSFEHLVAFDAQSALARMRVGQNIAPNRMGVQHGACTATASDSEMQQGLSRGAAFTSKHLAVTINQQDVIGAQQTLIYAA